MVSIIIRIITIDNSFITVNIDVFGAKVPFLLGLHVLDKYSVVVHTFRNTFDCPLMGWKIPIVRRLGHVYLEWNVRQILFMKVELQKLHRAFYHPWDDKLPNVIRLAHPKQSVPSDTKILTDISTNCETF